MRTEKIWNEDCTGHCSVDGELMDAWRGILRGLETSGEVKPLPTTRRFWRDEWHPYGWEVGFKMTVRWADGRTARVRFSDIGVDRNAAIANALRFLRSSGIHHQHPAAKSAHAAAMKTRQNMKVDSAS